MIKDFLEAIDYKITGGSEFTWTCFGPSARYLDSDDSQGADGRYSVNSVFDFEDQTVYVIEAWDYDNGREYRWLNPEFASEFNKECISKGIDPKTSIDGKKFIDLDVQDDILEKISKIVNGEEYDTRVKVPVDIYDKDLLKYMKLAHDLDITFNELVERAIQEAVDECKRNPEEFKRKAQRFLNED